MQSNMITFPDCAFLSYESMSICSLILLNDVHNCFHLHRAPG